MTLTAPSAIHPRHFVETSITHQLLAGGLAFPDYRTPQERTRAALRAVPLTVTVSQADIHNGVPGSCKFCPLAHAFNRALAADTDRETVHIDGEHVEFSSRVHGRWRTYYFGLPTEAKAFIRDFDNANPDRIKPFTFRPRFLRLE